MRFRLLTCGIDGLLGRERVAQLLIDLPPGAHIRFIAQIGNETKP